MISRPDIFYRSNVLALSDCIERGAAAGATTQLQSFPGGSPQNTGA